MTTLIAYDYSGSTDGVEHYHTRTQRIVADLKARGDTIKIFCWDTIGKEISEQELLRINTSREGNDGTEITNIATYVNKVNFTGKLVLITDGEVSQGSIEACDKMLGGVKRFTLAEIHIIGSSANLSVSCPFTRYCPHEINITPYANSNTETIIVSSESIGILDNLDLIETLEDFNNKKDQIMLALTARMMGTTINQNIHDAVVALSKRVLGNINQAPSRVEDFSKLGAEHWKESLQKYDTFVKEYYSVNDGAVFSRDINEILHITKGGLRGVFSHRLRRADVIDAVPLEQIAETPVLEDEADNHEAGNHKFTCAITLDLDSDPILLVRECPPVIQAMDERSVEDIFNCPLNALNYPAVCDAILKSFDSSMGLIAYKQAEESGFPITESPFTRQPIQSVLYFGANHSQVSGTNGAIARLLTGSSRKAIGNINLWFAVIMFLMEKVGRYADVIESVKRQMKWRLENTQTYAALCGLPEYPIKKVPLGLACWMVVVSPMLKLPTARDMIRHHVFHLDALFKLVTLADGYIDPQALQLLHRHARRLHDMFIMLPSIKRGDTLRALITALYQNCVLVGTEWIPLDGPASTDQITIVMEKLRSMRFQCSAADLIGLYQLMDVNLSIGSIPLLIDWEPVIPAAVVSWPAYANQTEDDYIDVKICPATCRPYYNVNSATWKEAARSAYKTTDTTNLISINACYIHFIEKYKAYPTMDELIVYCSRFYRNRNIPTLHPYIKKAVAEVVESYLDMILDVSIEEFLKRAEASLRIVDRVRIEHSA